MRISDWSSDVCSSDLRHLYGSAALCRGIAAPSCALCAGCQGQQQAAEQKCCGTPQDAVNTPHAPFSQTCRADSIAGTCAPRPLTLAICRPSPPPSRASAAGGGGPPGAGLCGVATAGPPV